VALVFGGLTAGAATAATVTITNVQTAVGNIAGVHTNISGAPANPWTTPILLTTSDSKTLVVFCDDLFHDINVPSSDTFLTGLVTTDTATPTSHSLSQKVSGTMGMIAQIGVSDYEHGNLAAAVAAQAAIWEVEYSPVYGSNAVTVDSAMTVNGGNVLHYFDIYKQLTYTGSSWGQGLIGQNGVQSQITGVPETSTWAMLLSGFAALAFAGYRRSKSEA
jgi:hypothetical protein